MGVMKTADLRAKLTRILTSIQDLDIGFVDVHLWNGDSLEKISDQIPPDTFHTIFEQLRCYQDFFTRLKKANLNPDSDFRELLKVANKSFGFTVDFAKIPKSVPKNCTLHAYSPSGFCLFFTPNFVHQVGYDLLTLVTVPWFELFTRQHNQDLDLFMTATQEFLTQGRQEPVDITAVPENILFLEKKLGRPEVLSRGYFFSPVFDQNNSFMATLVASVHESSKLKETKSA